MDFLLTAANTLSVGTNTNIEEIMQNAASKIDIQRQNVTCNAKLSHAMPKCHIQRRKFRKSTYNAKLSTYNAEWYMQRQNTQRQISAVKGLWDHTERSPSSGNHCNNYFQMQPHQHQASIELQSLTLHQIARYHCQAMPCTQENPQPQHLHNTEHVQHQLPKLCSIDWLILIPEMRTPLKQAIWGELEA